MTRQTLIDALNAVLLVAIGFDGYWFAMRLLNGDTSWLVVPAIGVMVWAWFQLGKSIEKEIDRENA